MDIIFYKIDFIKLPPYVKSATMDASAFRGES
jgi:hypothetical protein